MLTYNKQGLYFMFSCLIAAIVLVYFIIKPFLSALILAAVFAFLFQPIYKKFSSWFKQRQSLASLATTIVAVIIIILPLALLGGQIFKESSQLYGTLVNSGQGGFVVAAEKVVGQVISFLPTSQSFEIDFNKYLEQGLSAIVQNLGSVFSSLASILLSLFVFLMAFYFLLKDGNNLKNYFIDLSPLDDGDDNVIVSRLKLSILATVKGSLAIGLIQGVIAAIGFAIFNVPNPVLWGSVAAISALIPSIGTSLVIVPAVLFLFFTGNTFEATGLLIWGIFAVGLIDNILGPKLVSRGMKLHPLVVFLSVLGGLAFFGPLGFLLGPLAMSICLALIEIYFSLKNKVVA